MTTTIQKHACDPEYILGHWPPEYERLRAQSTFLNSDTERFLREAGIAVGMRVLDIGCGVGDVSLISAKLVGDTGEVTGIDLDGGALDVARGRANAMHLRNVNFIEGDFRKLDRARPFDALVGRLILIHLADPVEALRCAVGLIRGGGVIAIQDCVLRDDVALSSPRIELFHECLHVMWETVRRGGAHVELGLRLHRVFEQAGLPSPQMRWNQIVINRHTPMFCDYIQLFLKALAPKMEQLQVATAQEIGIDTVAERLRRELNEKDATLVYIPIVGASCRK